MEDIDTMNCKKYLLWFVSVLVLLLASANASAQDADKPCLEYAYPKGRAPSSEAIFDKKYDKLNVNSASFSCGPAIAASEARKALESFRYGVLYKDKIHLDAALRYPLTVRISKTLEASEKPKILVVHNSEEWITLQSKEMNKVQIALIACSWLGNVTVSLGSTPGFHIGGGLVWFQSSAGTSKVRVTSVNLMPLPQEEIISSCAP